MPFLQTGRAATAGATFNHMGIGDALRGLDDRVLGVPKQATAATHRSIFFLGLVGTLAVLIVVILTGESAAFTAVGGFVAFIIGGGVR